MSSRATIGIDVGGTFTDFAAVLPDGRLLLHKEPSTPHDPSLAVQLGIASVVVQEPSLSAGGTRIVHGTTLAINAVLQRKVAQIALVVSAGGRDVLEIGRAKLRTPYDFHITKETPIVSRDFVFEIPARMAADGQVLTSPSDAEFDRLAGQIAVSGVGAVAIMLLNSYVDPSLERDIAAAITARLPNLLVTCSADIWPEIREFERAVVACINAQIHPLMDAYLSRLGGRVSEVMATSLLQLSSSAGGTLSLQSTRARPIDTMMSGPASGATAAARVCNAGDIIAALTFDMGGTSADIAMINDGEVGFTTSARIGDLPLMMPVVGVSSIGAGGGSIISVDDYGVLKVGPDSAGANPGPVAYGLGGTRPTVTDCYLVLGLLDPDGFLGGRVKLDRQQSIAALDEIASRLGMPSAEAAAEAAVLLATVKMASELFKLLAQKGVEPSHHVLVPFGGAGPTHSVLLAQEAGLAGVAVPNAAATFCALGAALADVRRDFVRGLGRSRVHAAEERLWRNWDTLTQEAQEWLANEGVTVLSQRLVHAVDMQYSGQSFSLTVTIPPSVQAERRIGGVIEAFHQAHEAIYGFREPDHAVEAVTQRLSIIGEMPKVKLPELPPGQPTPTSRTRRSVFHAGAWLLADVYRREAFGAGSAAIGPAVVEQDDTTLWVLPGWRVTADRLGMLRVDRIANAA